MVGLDFLNGHHGAANALGEFALRQVEDSAPLLKPATKGRRLIHAGLQDLISTGVLPLMARADVVHRAGRQARKGVRLVPFPAVYACVVTRASTRVYGDGYGNGYGCAIPRPAAPMLQCGTHGQHRRRYGMAHEHPRSDARRAMARSQPRAIRSPDQRREREGGTT